MEKRDLEKAHPFNAKFVTYDFDAIEEVLSQNPDLLAAWAEYVGVSPDDERLLDGCWADKLIPFYAGFIAGYNSAEKNSEVFHERDKKELQFIPI